MYDDIKGGDGYSNDKHQPPFIRMEDTSPALVSSLEYYEQPLQPTTTTTTTMQQPQEESHIRSLVKGITWRILATMTTVLIAYFVIGDVGSALQIGLVEFLAKLFLYYIHERIWACLKIL